MNRPKDAHLHEDQIIRAVVDEADLAPQEEGHLSACPACRAEKERLEKGLERLGDMAKEFAPSPGRTVSLPVEEARGSLLVSWGVRPAFAMALSAVVIAWVLWAALLRLPPEDRQDRFGREMADAELLMSEVDALVENALPDLYLDISGESEEDSDEDVFELIVPSINHSSQTQYLRKKGGKSLC
jgi:hypothetical protein